jgi:hypothetical protein
MDVGRWLSEVGNAGRLFLGALPDALWLAYSWAKEWQSLLAGLLLLLAARIFSQGSARAARIRATGMIRAAQIAAGTGPGILAEPKTTIPAPGLPSSPPISAETDLVQRLDQIRSLIRSAMSTLTPDTGKPDAGPNFYCERIAALRFDEGVIPPGLSPAARELHARLLAQLAALRQANEDRIPPEELSRILVQLNRRARELAAALAPLAQQLNVPIAGNTRQARA